jgi:hypothetical protein
LKRNTARANGIFASSLVLFFIAFSCLPGWSADKITRSYEAQFFSVKLQGKLDYKRLEQTGINGIIYRVFWDDEVKGGLYFENSLFRTLEPALPQLITGLETSRSNLQLCAWMIARKFKWVDDPAMMDYQYEDGERSRIRKLDIFNPLVLQKLMDLYRELASHKIDRILIQDDLTLRYNEGFSNWGKAKFTAETEARAWEKLMMRKDTPYNANWNRVKVKQLNKVITLLVKSCKRVNSAIKVGMNVYYEAPVFTKKAEAWYGHNLSEIAETGLDYIYLMSYQRQIKQEMRLSETKTRQLFKRIVETAYDICKDKLVVKIQLRDWQTSERVPVEEVKAYMALIPARVKRVCFTPVTPDDYDYLKEIILTANRANKHE